MVDGGSTDGIKEFIEKKIIDKKISEIDKEFMMQLIRVLNR